MRTIIAAAFGAALFLGGSALAAKNSTVPAQDTTVPATGASTVPAEVSKQDYLKAIHDACPTTNVTTPEGTVEPTVGCTRGFSLATEGPGAPAKGKAKAAGHASLQRVSATAPAHSSRLSDLLIHFKLGSAELTAQGQANAGNFASALKDPSVSKLKFEISGHTDASGTASRNQELSQQRAEAVRDYLVAQGVDGSRLTAKGYGSSELAAPGAPRSAANRRVEARPL